MAGRDRTSALGLFDEELSGRRAAEIGLAWEALPAGQVDDRALSLTARAGADPVLARRMAVSMRSELGPPSVPWPVALDAERSAQMWSLRRRA